jgi:hypothetical protein
VTPALSLARSGKGGARPIAGCQMAFVIVRREGVNRAQGWLVTVSPQQWGEREHAMRFWTRAEARRASDAIKLSGDWAIEPALPPPLTAPR